MTKKQPINYEQLGDQCKVAREELLKILELSRGLPIEITKHVQKSIEQLDQFRSKAEDRMLKEHPEKSLDIFYGQKVKPDEKGGEN